MVNITDKTLRWLVGGVLFFVMAGLAYTYSSAKGQDEQFLQSYSQFEQARTLFDHQQFDQALPLLQELEQKQPDSALIKNYLGIAYLNTGDIGAAVTKYKSVLDLNPYKVENALFMIQFGEILLLDGKKAEAVLVLEKCLTLAPPAEMPDYQVKVQELLAQANGQ